jgi:hypothetical protein
MAAAAYRVTGLARLTLPTGISARHLMTKPSLVTRDLTIRFGGHVAVDAVTCAFRAGR